VTTGPGIRGQAVAEVPHCYVPAAFDPEQHQALEQHLRRLVGAAEWLEREVRAERECHATLAQAAVLEHELRDVVATLVDGHLRHCVIGAIEQGQRPEEVGRLFAPIRSILFATQR
jgi:DNA-binding FrmR family transcriptional regulator